MLVSVAFLKPITKSWHRSDFGQWHDFESACLLKVILESLKYPLSHPYSLRCIRTSFVLVTSKRGSPEEALVPMMLTASSMRRLRRRKRTQLHCRTPTPSSFQWEENGTRESSSCQHVREDIGRKKTFSFGHCSNEWGGRGLPMPGIFGPLFLPSNSP